MTDDFPGLVIYTAFVLIFQTIFTSIDHHWSQNMFATCGQQLDIWDEDRTEPVRSFTWGVDSLHAVKFNPIEVTCNYVFNETCLSYLELSGNLPWLEFLYDSKIFRSVRNSHEQVYR